MATQTVTAEELGLAQAIADTEEEIFTDANGTDPLDNDGDRSLEQTGSGLEGEMTDEDETDDEESETEEIEAQAETEESEEPEPAETPAATEPDGQRPGLVPSGRLREIREAKDAEIAALRAEFDAFKAGINQRPAQQQQQPPKAEAPDQFAEPEKHTQWVIDQAVQAAQFRHVEASLQDAADTHGDKFQTAYRELQTLGQTERNQFGNSPSIARIWNSPNPGKALMSWHAQQSTIREVGNDPNAWLEKKLQERLNDPDFLATAIERARGSARQNGAREYTGAGRGTRMPPSLNTQTGSSHQVDDPDLYDTSEKSVFNFATR